MFDYYKQKKKRNSERTICLFMEFIIQLNLLLLSNNNNKKKLGTNFHLGKNFMLQKKNELKIIQFEFLLFKLLLNGK